MTVRRVFARPVGYGRTSGLLRIALFAVLACGFALGLPAASIQDPLPLGPDDFTVNGIALLSDSGVVYDVLGAPDSVGLVPWGYGDTMELWSYGDMRIRLNHQKAVHGIWITGVGVATHRGLRVGDGRDTVLDLYGRPAQDILGKWTYEDAGDGLMVIIMQFGDAGVTEIFIGFLMD